MNGKTYYQTTFAFVFMVVFCQPVSRTEEVKVVFFFLYFLVALLTETETERLV